MNKQHLTDQGLKKIFSIRASIGKGLSDNLTGVFSDIVPYEKPVINVPKLIDNHWLAGFSTAEGCFESIIRNNSTTKIGQQVIVRFTLAQHSRDLLLFETLKRNLGCGVLRVDSKKPIVTLSISNFEDIFNIIIPLFDKFSILGNKKEDYQDFRKIAF